MIEYHLKPAVALSGYTRQFSGVAVSQIDGLEVVSINLALGSEQKFGKLLELEFGIELPEHNTSVVTKIAKARILRMQANQLLLMFDRDKQKPVDEIIGKMNGLAYSTTLSDGVVGLQIMGTNSKAVLERICPIDLHSESFRPNGIARTKMEHQSITVVCEKNNCYLLLVPRSSAGSFLHAIETSMQYVV